MRAQAAARDRRVAPRYLLEVPIRVRLWKSDMPEETSRCRDLSGSGALFSTELPVELGTAIEVRLQMPEEITGKEAAEWTCSAHVVRIEPQREGRKRRVAVQFDCYEIARKDKTR